MSAKQPRESIDWFDILVRGIIGAFFGAVAGWLLLFLRPGRFAFEVVDRFGWPWPFVLAGAIIGGLLSAWRGLPPPPRE